MLLWIIFAVITAFVLIALLMPFRRRSEENRLSQAGYDLAVYRDQLAELDRDEKAGLIAGAEADAARNEISRRILSAEEALKADTGVERPVPTWMSVAVGIAVPAIALAGYLYIGRPDLPAQPLQARIDNAVESNNLSAMVLQVERHLQQKPDDLRGWTVIAPVYKRMARFSDAANAYRRIISLSEPSAELMAELGETLVLASNGIVQKDASNIFAEAVKLDENHMKARFYVALGFQQQGKTPEALKIWNAMLAGSPADAPWRAAVEQQIKAAGAELPKGPELSQEQMQAGAEMNADERTAMIRSMVEGLDERLKQDGSNLEGWLRLVQARMVLGEKDKAAEALARAAVAMKDRPDALNRIDETRKALGL